MVSYSLFFGESCFDGFAPEFFTIFDVVTDEVSGEVIEVAFRFFWNPVSCIGCEIDTVAIDDGC